MELKDHMTMEEMQALHKEWYPFLVVNKVNVGRLAKRLGYKRIQQNVDGVMVNHYIKGKYLNNKI